MLSGIAPPPMPPAGILLGAGVAGLVLGVVLLLLGRRWSKLIMCLAFAGAAGGCMPLLVTGLSGTNTLIAAVVAALFAGTAGFVFSRCAWSLLLGVLLSSAALVAFATVYASGLEVRPAWPGNPGADFPGWVAALGQYTSAWTSALWQYNALAVALSVLAPLGIGVALGVFYPQAMLVFTTSLTGAILAVSGAGAAAWAARPESAGAWIQQIHVPGVVAGALLLVGLVLQTRKLMKKGKPAPAPGKGDPEAKPSK